MNERKVDRRGFFREVGIAGAAVAGTAWALSACGKGEAPAKPKSCTDLSGIAEADAKLRIENQYVDKTAKPEQHCANCLQWVPPADPSQCGGCKVLKGPIHPDGWCKLWAPKA